MDKTLQLLLDAELRAEKIAKHAEQEQERIIQGALLEARGEEGRFEARIPEIHSSFLEKADLRAEQTVGEIKRRYDDRRAELRDLAEERENEALEAAFAILLNPETED